MPEDKLQFPLEIAILISRSIRGELTGEEQLRLEQWISVSDQNRKLYHELIDEQLRSGELKRMQSFDLETGWGKAKKRMHPAKISYRLTALRYAAAIIALVGFVILVIRIVSNQQSKDRKGEVVIATEYDLPPGSTKAYIKTADGAPILLDSTADSSFYASGTLVRQQQGQLIIAAPAQNDVPVHQLFLYTPRGGQYSLVLEDGTRAWLNSASSLVFPNRFSGKERNVILTGEAYFEVVHNPSVPFIVSLNGTQVKALGTAFNVKAYQDDNSMQATLVEGAVHVIREQKTAVLTPGKQAIIGATGVDIREANITAITAWKNGQFIFRDMELEEVLKQLSRWYDIDITYEPGFKATSTFTARISRQVPISRLLRLMEQTGIARFSLRGRKLTVLSYEHP